MGVVYEARQLSLHRKVALKVLSAGLGLTGNAVARFRREAEAAARLHHTNIVPVYATGEQDSIHFYAMELIEGPSLDEVLERAKQAGKDRPRPEDITSSPPELVETAPYLPRSGATGPAPGSSSSSLGSGSGYFDAAARMIADVADALEHAHCNGVIHRDIKPSNLLLTPEGRLSVNDFGLARLLEQPGMTMSGEFVGTPAYMSPEQITAGRTPLDHRTDVYSLGATLYELLTLRRPFTGDRRDQVLAHILYKEPTPPRRVDRHIPIDLETICLKAMEKDPDRRYQTAGQMADDLRRYVNRFAISARRAGPLTRMTKWMRRHPSETALLGCLVIALAAVGYFAHRTRLAQNEILAEQRQVAVDKAILEAMSGDAHSALQAVADAESKGAEPGRLNLLRGLVEHYQGRSREALVYLEQAEKQLPESIAVKAVLADAYALDGEWQRYDELYVLLQQARPKTTEDYLFLGLSQAEMDPVQALQTLEKAPARFRQSAVARFARAMAQSILAQFTGRLETAKEAIDGLEQSGIGDGLTLLYWRLETSMVVARVCSREDPRREAALKQAISDAEELGQYLENSRTAWSRCKYFVERGDYDALLKEADRARSKGIEIAYMTNMAASVLYGRKQFDEALSLLETSKFTNKEPFLQIARGTVLAAIPGRREDAKRVLTDLVRDCLGGTTLSIVAAPMQLLGSEYLSKSKKAAREIRERASDRIPNARNDWYHHLLAFETGEIDDDELLKRAGESHVNQCEAYYVLGLRTLAEGKRQQAKKFFELAYKSYVVHFEA
jgi:tetratricopeptide (TPR) repeat protein